MNILVTGGSGFVGQHLIRRLVKEHIVINLDYQEPVSPYPEKEVCPIIQKKVNEIEESYLASFNYIIHLAAQTSVPQSIREPQSTLDNNIFDTLYILERLRNLKTHEYHVPHLIFFSTDSVYGKTNEYPITESARTEPTNPYGISKLATEQLCKFYKQAYNLPITILRCSMMIGEGNVKGVVPAFIRQCYFGEPIVIEGDGSTTKDVNYVGNTVDAVLALINSGYCPTTINIGSGQDISINDLAKIILIGTGSKSEIKYGPSRPGEDGIRSCLDISTAQQLLHYEPKVQLKEALNKTIKYFYDHRVNQLLGLSKR